jgi:hypothetical protein
MAAGPNLWSTVRLHPNAMGHHHHDRRQQSVKKIDLKE